MATTNTAGAIVRITKDIAAVAQSSDLSLAVAHKDSDVRNVRALIIGPPETPYEFGFFEFEIKFSKNYPIESPNVRAITTNSGRTRFNPNIYNEGKVCLSILGTWRGNPGEEWSSAQGLESILLSIQSLMSQNPYENEPGFDTAKKEEPRPKAYIAKIRHETLRITIIKRLEGLLGIVERGQPAAKRARIEGLFSPHSATFQSPEGTDSNGTNTAATKSSVYEYDAEATYVALDTSPWDPFADVMKRRFLWYYDTYLATVSREEVEQKTGAPFTRVEFEYPPNSMEGAFDYPALRTRLERIREKLNEEQEGWLQDGKKQVDDATQLATMLAFQFKQLEHRWNETTYHGSRMEIQLPDPENPFKWTMTMFGKPMTNLDGGIFNITMHIPPNFPDTQPRVKIETPIFHHRVSSSTGTLCYFPKKEDEIAFHLLGIVEAIEDEKPKYDPRAVINPEPFALYWGGDDKRKIYNRKLRRSAQESYMNLDPRKAETAYEWSLLSVLQKLHLMED